MRLKRDAQEMQRKMLDEVVDVTGFVVDYVKREEVRRERAA
jgi:hypothetical protein